MKWLSLLLVVFLPANVLADERHREIVVSATGQAEAPPDMATITLGVSEDAPTASEAMAAAGAGSQGILETVLAAGIEARDVQTSSINLNPIWDQGNTRPRQIRGYVASIMMTVRVRDLDLLGQVLDSAVGDGANALNGLSFGIADAEPLEQIARADAVARAERKADTLAAAAGVTLGPVQTISEVIGGGAPVPMMRGAMMEAAAVPIAAGEVDVRVSVTVVYEIAD